MKTILTLLALTTVLVSVVFAEDDAHKVAEATLVHVGDVAPDFSVELMDGGTFDLADHKGEVVLVNWFATWCGPCKAEMPHLQREVWERFENDGLVMVSIAREETTKEVGPFIEKYGVTWPFALDPDRKAYAPYASGYIPRNFVIDREGKVVYQSQGFERREFDEMIAVLAGELGVTDARTSAPLDRHYEAIGTAEARYAIESITAEAACVSSGGAYRTLLKMAPWGRIVFRQEPEDDKPVEVVMDGAEGWMAGEPIDAVTRWVARGHAFPWLMLEVEDWFTDLTPAGEAEFAGQMCTVWTGRDGLGDDNRLYFAEDTGLLAGLDLPNHLFEGRVKVVFDRWRTVDGVRLPDHVTATDFQGDFTLDFRKISTNDVDVAVFDPPAK